jgi:hypothetical protein
VDSILDSVKKLMGIDPTYDAFDVDMIMHINAVLATLNQIGIGPTEGYAIEDASATWSDFLGTDPRLNDAKTYMYMKIKVLFDPPEQWHLMAAMKEQIVELEWRISVKRENEQYVAPVPAPAAEPEVIIIPVDQAWYRE